MYKVAFSKLIFSILNSIFSRIENKNEILSSGETLGLKLTVHKLFHMISHLWAHMRTQVQKHFIQNNGSLTFSSMKLFQKFLSATKNNFQNSSNNFDSKCTFKRLKICNPLICKTSKSVAYFWRFFRKMGQLKIVDFAKFLTGLEMSCQITFSNV